MCHTTTSVYPCGHTRAIWYNCHDKKADLKPLGTVTSPSCKLCDPLACPLERITGWDTCVVRKLQRTQSKWQCCRCKATNSPNTLSCLGEVKSAATFDNGKSWVCQHSICLACYGVDDKNHTYLIPSCLTCPVPVVTPGEVNAGCCTDQTRTTSKETAEKRKRSKEDNKSRTEKPKIRYRGPGWHQGIDPGFYLCFTDSEDEEI